MLSKTLEALVKAVKEHYEEQDPKPLLLSRFGQSNKELLAQLKSDYGSLAAAVRAAGEENLRFVDTTIGRETIAPTGIAGSVGLEIKQESASQHQAANFFDGLPSSVKLAFCIRTEAAEHVALDIVRPFRYSKVTVPDLIRPTQRIIPNSLRRPGLPLRNASVQERAILWGLFLTWTQEIGIDIETFRNGETSNALARLIAAQSPDIMSGLIIPADIAQILLKHA
ncbi:hypothetical protein GCM10007870_28150 [Gluconobacter kondonii]|uniref:Uncharacterized protein n=1 Tax=Gluconobacter kondonii TaxID=941463 RepID=A0ABQ5WUK8_9PROT|nr:hypothetical protein AA3266_1955 [Gluconobacter kondonii NBRC 3266]GLQ67230.1 hypothetical protein GCM10007870_28150 [Gluconobacter kondonii]